LRENSAEGFWNNRIGDNPDFSSIGCAGFGLQYNRWLYRIRAHRFRKVAGDLPFELRSASVLDVGSGTGFYLKLWQDLGVVAPEALDFSGSAVGFLKRQYPQLKIHQLDIGEQTLALPAQSYDVISAFDVFFHIVDDNKYATALRNVAKLLKPGGYLLFSENFTHHEHPRGGDYHYSRTLEVISALVGSVGLKIEYRRPMFVLMNAPDDSTGRWTRLRWRLIRRIATHSEKAGWLMGIVLYPQELVLTAVKRESSTTEIAVCKKRHH
jgi:SAM-dependent methyltransferase